MALTQYYVDPSIAADSGTGTSGDPFGDLQFGFNTVTRDSTNGDQFNIRSGTAEVLAASLTLATYGTPAIGAPLVLRGYTSAANDGGMGEIDCGGATMWASNAYDNIIFIDLEMHSFGDNDGINLDDNCVFVRCEVHKGASSPSTKHLVRTIGPTVVLGCHVHSPGTNGTCVRVDESSLGLHDSYIVSDGQYGVYVANASFTATGNIIHCQAVGTKSIRTGSFSLSNISQNIIYNAAAGTGSGIEAASSSRTTVLNNIISGWSGAGGAGIRSTGTGSDLLVVGYNAHYNNTSNIVLADIIVEDLTANDISLGAAPFADAANGDFSLTETAKAALRSVGWPASYLGAHANSDPHITIGAMQYGPTPGASGGGRRPRIRTHGV